MASRKPPEFGGTPRVDLLPDAQRAEIQHERTLPKLLLALIASAAVAGLIWAAGTVPVRFAEQELSALQAQSQQLTVDIANYDETQTLLSAVGSRETDRQKLTEEEVLFMELRDQLASRLPASTSFAKFTAQMPSAEVVESLAEVDEGCAASGAIATVVLTTVEPAALSLAATFIDSMSDIEGFLCATVTGSEVLAGAESEATEVHIRATFDDTVRAGRFAGEAE